jgi:CheY-like chemotaxis protein
VGKKILVVDNHPVMLKFMANLLEKERHHVVTAENGLAALDILNTFIPDVVFIDLIMPHISGDKLCEVIRRTPKLEDVYIVILSAVAAEGMNVSALVQMHALPKGPLTKCDNTFFWPWRNLIRHLSPSFPVKSWGVKIFFLVELPLNYSLSKGTLKLS